MLYECRVCGTSISYENCEEALKRAEAMSLTLPTSMCRKCASKYLDYRKNSALENQAPFITPPKKDARKLIVSTIVPDDVTKYKVLGVATAHVALGTGPISQLFSSVTDFFGSESNAYNQKIQEAETACMQKLRQRAIEMKANAVVGLAISYTELTRGHGMLMVNMSGTAIKYEEIIDEERLN